MLESSKWVRTHGPTRHTHTQVGLIFFFFYKCQYGSTFDLAHQEPSSSRLNPWWAGLAHQPVWSHTLCWTLQCWVVFLTKHISGLTNGNLASTPNT